MRLHPYFLAALTLWSVAVGCSGNSVEHGTVGFDVSPDGKEIVFPSPDGDLFILNLESQKVRRLTDTDSEETSPAFSPDGATVVYAAKPKTAKGSMIFSIAPDGANVKQLTDDPEASDVRPAYSRDGSRIVFARAHRHRPYSMGGWTWDDWDVYIMDADGGNLTRVTRSE